MRFSIKGATEATSSVSSELLEQTKESLKIIEGISSFDELLADSKAPRYGAPKQFFNVPRGTRPYSWVTFIANRKVFIYIAFYLRKNFVVDMMGPELLTSVFSFTDNILSIATENYYRDSSENSGGFGDIYYKYTPEDIKTAVLFDLPSAERWSDAQIGEYFNQNQDKIAGPAGLFVMTDDYLVDFFDEIKAQIIKKLNSMIASYTKRTQAAQFVGISSDNNTDFAPFIEQMHSTGGEITINGKSGLLFEVYQSTVGNRVRTNDGVNGLNIAAFPANFREDNAIYLVPADKVSWNGSNYRISSDVDLFNCRVK